MVWAWPDAMGVVRWSGRGQTQKTLAVSGWAGNGKTKDERESVTFNALVHSRYWYLGSTNESAVHDQGGGANIFVFFEASSARPKVPPGDAVCPTTMRFQMFLMA